MTDAADASLSHGQIVLAVDADVLDIGISGVAIESGTRLTPESGLRLTLGVADRSITFEGRVVWCFFHGTRPGDGGEPLPVYRAGIEFSDVLTPRAERMVDLLENLAAASGETRLFGRFRLSTSEPVRVQAVGAFRCLEVGQHSVVVESALQLEPVPGCAVELRPASTPTAVPAHVVDARREPRSDRWRLTLATDPASDSLSALRALLAR